MKSQKQDKQFSLFLILLFSIMSIQLEAQAVSFGNSIKSDSVKFSKQETRILLSAYQICPNLYRLIDSCESELVEIRAIIKNDSLENYGCEHVNITQNVLIAEHQKETERLEKVIKKETFFKKFWRTTTIILAVPAGSIFLYERLNK